MKEDTQSDTPDSQPARPFLPTKLRIALWLGVLLAVILWCFPGEPMHDGLTLSEWLENRIVGAQSAEAITQIGTNGIPIYLKMLEAKDSEFKTKLIKQLNKLPLVEFDPFTASDRQQAAIWALKTLGTNALPAYPTLLNMLKQDICPTAIHDALMAISPEDESATQFALNHSNPLVRLSTVNYYDRRRYQFDSIAIPVDDLLPVLRDPYYRVRWACVNALGLAAETNSSVRAALKLCLTDKGVRVRSSATNILHRLAAITNSTSSISAPK
jgi:hypothetical protein